jgi:ankyrin repeat protein
MDTYLYCINMDNLITLNSESLVLKQLFSLWDQAFSCNAGYSSFFKNLCSGTAKALGIFLIQYLVKNPDKILSFFRMLALKFIYRRLELKVISGTNDFNMNKILQKEINAKNEPCSSVTLSGLPLYLNVNGIYTTLEYCPLVHQKFLTAISSEANDDSLNKNGRNKEIKTVCRDATKKIFVPDSLFPSKNYQKLDAIIDNFFTVVNKTKMYKAQGILIDGEPGLGKSKSCDYLASLNKYHEIYYINLSLPILLKKDFKSIIDDIISKRNGRTIIYFDELDKYLAFYVEYSFYKQEDIEDFNEYKRYYKQEFLYELLAIIETSAYEDGLVCIFCSNNFHTIFEDVDQVHFNSLKRRFAPIQFERCDREELIKFIQYFNTRMLDTKMHYPEAKLEHLVQNLKPQISLTYHSVRYCHIATGYDIENFINFINVYEPEPTLNIKKSRPVNIKRIILKEKKEDKKETKKEEKKESKEVKQKEDKEAEQGEERREEKFWDIVNNGNVEELRQILETDIDVDMRKNSGFTALMLTSRDGKLECVQELVKAGASLDLRYNSPTCNGFTALMFASMCGKLDCAKELLNAGASINIQDIVHGNTALHTASGNNHIEIVKILLEYQADTSVKSKSGATTLHVASAFGYIDIVKILLENGADVSITNDGGKTPADVSKTQEIRDLINSYS